MISARIKSLIPTGLALALLAGLFFAASPTQDYGAAANPCANRETSARYDCYRTRFEELLRADGLEAAVGFALAAAREDADPTVAHNFLHPIGQEAYRATGNLEGAREHLDRYYARYRSGLPPGTLETDIVLEGYHHGVLQAYLAERGDVPRLGLMAEACASVIDLERPADPIARKSSSRCFHALGHALMYANQNHLWRSLADCDLLPRPWTRGYCYYGAVMEHHYRSNPALGAYVAPHTAAPTPPVQPLRELCPKVAGPYRTACHRLVGRDELVRNRGDFAAAFAACRELGAAADHGPCITETAFGLVTLGDDFNTMLAECRQTGGYERECIIGTAVGINSKPELGQLERFCAAVPEEFRRDCKTADASYAALDFTP